MDTKSAVPAKRSAALSARDPFAALRREMNALFDDFFPGAAEASGSLGMFMPRVDVKETDGEIRVTAEMPGMLACSCPPAKTRRRPWVRCARREQRWRVPLPRRRATDVASGRGRAEARPSAEHLARRRPWMRCARCGNALRDSSQR